jgi:hypothetical protein
MRISERNDRTGKKLQTRPVSSPKIEWKSTLAQLETSETGAGAAKAAAEWPQAGGSVAGSGTIAMSLWGGFDAWRTDDHPVAKNNRDKNKIEVEL